MSKTASPHAHPHRRPAVAPRRGTRPAWAGAATTPRAITLLEMILVIAILGALVALAGVSYASIRNVAYDRATEARLSQMAKVGMADVIFGGNSGAGFQPDASDFAATNASASNIYKDMDFIPATESADNPGEVSIAIGDSSQQKAAVAWRNGDLAAFATRSRSGKCTFAVVDAMGGTTAWSKSTDDCMASGALVPLTYGERPTEPTPTTTPGTGAGETTASPTPSSAPTATGTDPGTTTGAGTSSPAPSPTGTSTPAPTPTATGTPVHYCNGRVATVVGTDGDDILYGDGDDVIVGLGGNDRIYLSNRGDIACGGDGQDIIYGGNGKDIIFGDDGNDNLYGENGSDVIYGGGGDDYLVGGHGPDTLIGGDGEDTIVAEKGGPSTVVQDGPNS